MTEYWTIDKYQPFSLKKHNISTSKRVKLDVVLVCSQASHEQSFFALINLNYFVFSNSTRANGASCHTSTEYIIY